MMSSTATFKLKRATIACNLVCNIAAKRVEKGAAFHLGKKPRNSVGAKVEFPIGKKLFHLVINPGTSRCPTVDLELVQTTRNVNGTRHSVRKFQPGKRTHLFRFSTLSGNFLASHAGVYGGARFSSLPTNTCSTKDDIPFPSLANHIVLPKFWKVDLDRDVT